MSVDNSAKKNTLLPSAKVVEDISVDFTSEQLGLFNKMTDYMLDYNSKVNLTAITEHDEIYEKHYIDSVLPLILENVPRGTHLIDFGTGAGFPGIPIKIVRPDIDVTLLDSLKKRVLYLDLLSAVLGIDITAIHGRGEELSVKHEFREFYDVGISRAVANLAALSEYVLPFVKVGGCFMAMKGERDETKEAANAVNLLGGSIDRIYKYKLPSGDLRTLIVIKKISHTPSKFPRVRVNISKNPL